MKEINRFIENIFNENNHSKNFISAHYKLTRRKQAMLGICFLEINDLDCCSQKISLKNYSTNNYYFITLEHDSNFSKK